MAQYQYDQHSNSQNQNAIFAFNEKSLQITDEFEYAAILKL